MILFLQKGCVMPRFETVVGLIVLMFVPAFAVENPELQLSVRTRHDWDVLGVESRSNPDAVMTLLFYEWNLFGTLENQEHFRGNYFGPWSISEDKREVRREMKDEGMRLRARLVEDGADLLLTVKNKSSLDWPELGTIIPCLSAGDAHIKDAPDKGFFDPGHTHTYFVGPDGLELLQEREIHFNQELVTALHEYSPDGTFVFSHKWPTSDRYAATGIMIRESEDKSWVAAVAWERFLAAQGHNPLRCMHLSVRVGPLKQQESRQVRGKIYFFQGTKEECLERFQRDFGLRQ